MKVLPFKSEPSWEMEIELENQVYRFDFTWNPLYEYWAMGIYERNRQPIITGIKLVITWDLLGPYVTDGLPPGALVTLDTTGELLRIGRYDMGNRILLVYYDSSELEETINAVQ